MYWDVLEVKYIAGRDWLFALPMVFLVFYI